MLELSFIPSPVVSTLESILVLIIYCVEKIIDKLKMSDYIVEPIEMLCVITLSKYNHWHSENYSYSSNS